MDKIKEIDLLLEYANKAKALEEIFFCTMHPQLTGPHRRETAISTYAQICVRIEKLKD